MFHDIQTDPDVCSNCFRRTHDRYERNYRLEVMQVENDEGKLEWTTVPVEVSGIEYEKFDPDKQEMVTEEIGGFDDRVFRRAENTTKIPEKGAIRGMRTICECGFRYVPDAMLGEDETWKNRPLDKKTFFEYADHLIERLRESGASIDEETYYEELDRMKSDPDQQFQDDGMFEKAIEFASSIETVRSTSQSTSPTPTAPKVQREEDG